MSAALTSHIAYMKTKYTPIFANDYRMHHYQLKEFYLDILTAFSLVESDKQDKAGVS